MTARSVLVTGSTAIDQTGFYDGSFRQYQKQYPMEAMNASFQLAGMRTSFGGCAPNIAYGLHQLGVDVIPLSSAGRNFLDHYRSHLLDLGINIDYITVDEAQEHCASCLMINDDLGNQIIGFYPGPKDPKRKLPHEIIQISDVKLAILGPEEPGLTLRQARDLSELSIPIMADPGQVTATFVKEEILELLRLADFLIVNQYEHEIIKTNAQLDDKALTSMLHELVVTRGEHGVDVYSDNQVHHVDATPEVDIVDVTGCGDAFRAGYAYGYLCEQSVEEKAQLGCLMAMLNLKSPETQRYITSADNLTELRSNTYG